MGSSDLDFMSSSVDATSTKCAAPASGNELRFFIFAGQFLRRDWNGLGEQVVLLAVDRGEFTVRVPVQLQHILVRFIGFRSFIKKQKPGPFRKKL